MHSISCVLHLLPHFQVTLIERTHNPDTTMVFRHHCILWRVVRYSKQNTTFGSRLASERCFFNILTKVKVFVNVCGNTQKPYVTETKCCSKLRGSDNTTLLSKQPDIILIIYNSFAYLARCEWKLDKSYTFI